MKNMNGKNSGIFSGANAARIIVALICLCLIGGLMIYSFQSALDRNEAESGAGNGANDVNGADERTDLSVSSNIPVTDSAGAADSAGADADGKSTDKDDVQENITVMPAEGNIIRDYSGEGLVYSETLNQYLAHKAVDIGAPIGTDVIAVESGTVIAVDDDDRYGLTVTLSHGNSLETSYANLAEASVAEGDVVNKGDKLGTVGQGALFESADDPHLHFAAHKNGEAVDPHKLWNW